MMVGDSAIDILAAYNAGSKSCYVRYGYGDNPVAIKLKPDYYLHTFDQVLDVI